MDKNKIIRMAREAGGYLAELPNGDAWLFDDNQQLERFFNLAFTAGAAHEREACAKVCEELRGGYTTLQADIAATQCAAAIRARGIV